MMKICDQVELDCSNPFQAMQTQQPFIIFNFTFLKAYQLTRSTIISLHEAIIYFVVYIIHFLLLYVRVR